jgi:hypothetical protein
MSRADRDLVVAGKYPNGAHYSGFLVGLLSGKLILSIIYKVPMGSLEGDSNDVQQFVIAELGRRHAAAAEPLKSLIAVALALLLLVDCASKRFAFWLQRGPGSV